MNYYDTFDENGIFLSSEDEKDVHYKGLWHKVIRLWIYDSEGNIWLKRSKSTGKLDAINELHLLSTESVTSCCDRALFQTLGIHLPATSNVSSVGMKQISLSKLFSDNSEFKENYFLCDYIASSDGKERFFIFDEDTDAVVKCNAAGIINLILAKSKQIIGLEYKEDATTENKIAVSYLDIAKNPNEDTFAKFSAIANIVEMNVQKIAREKQEEEKISKFAKNLVQESHANENDGSEVY